MSLEYEEGVIWCKQQNREFDPSFLMLTESMFENVKCCKKMLIVETITEYCLIFSTPINLQNCQIEKKV